MAPTGQTAAHWPQPTQSTSNSPLPKAGDTWERDPRCVNSRTPIPWISEQKRTQSPQRTHLLGSRTRLGLVRSRGFSSTGALKRTSVTPRRSARDWSLQEPLFPQVGQSWLPLARSSSMFVLRSSRTGAVWVFTFIPASGAVVQAVTRPRPSTSTMQSRQAP